MPAWKKIANIFKEIRSLWVPDFQSHFTSCVFEFMPLPPNHLQVEKAQATFGDALNACWARKLGLHVPPASASSDDEAAAAATASPFGVVDSEVGELFQELEPLLRKVPVKLEHSM